MWKKKPTSGNTIVSYLTEDIVAFLLQPSFLPFLSLSLRHFLALSYLYFSHTFPFSSLSFCISSPPPHPNINMQRVSEMKTQDDEFSIPDTQQRSDFISVTNSTNCITSLLLFTTWSAIVHIPMATVPWSLSRDCRLDDTSRGRWRATDVVRNPASLSCRWPGHLIALMDEVESGGGRRRLPVHFCPVPQTLFYWLISVYVLTYPGPALV